MWLDMAMWLLDSRLNAGSHKNEFIFCDNAWATGNYCSTKKEEKEKTA